MSPVSIWPVALGLALVACSWTGRPAQAFTIYLEGGGGLSSVRIGSPFFGGVAPSESDWGAAADLGFFTTFTDGFSVIEFQLGVVGRGLTSGSNGQAWEMIAPYPVVRLQVSKLYLGFGATPFVWNSVGSGLNLNFTNYPGIAYLMEAGVLFAGTPHYSVSLQATGQMVSAPSGTLSPAPALDLDLILRFYFNLFSSEHLSAEAAPGSSSGGGARTPNEYKGWRYPWGFR